MKKSALLLIPAACLLLTACQSRVEVDEKLAKGCQSGAKYIMQLKENEFEIIKLKGFTAKKDAKDKALRQVTIHTLATFGGYMDEDKDIDCSFNETYNFGFMGHNAEISKITIDEETYGRIGGDLKNLSIAEFQTLVGKIQNAM